MPCSPSPYPPHRNSTPNACMHTARPPPLPYSCSPTKHDDLPGPWHGPVGSRPIWAEQQAHANDEMRAPPSLQPGQARADDGWWHRPPNAHLHVRPCACVHGPPPAHHPPTLAVMDCSAEPKSMHHAQPRTILYRTVAPGPSSPPPTLRKKAAEKRTVPCSACTCDMRHAGPRHCREPCQDADNQQVSISTIYAAMRPRVPHLNRSGRANTCSCSLASSRAGGGASGPTMRVICAWRARRFAAPRGSPSMLLLLRCCPRQTPQGCTSREGRVEPAGPHKGHQRQQTARETGRLPRQSRSESDFQALRTLGERPRLPRPPNGTGCAAVGTMQRGATDGPQGPCQEAPAVQRPKGPWVDCRWGPRTPGCTAACASVAGGRMLRGG